MLNRCFFPCLRITILALVLFSSQSTFATLGIALVTPEGMVVASDSRAVSVNESSFRVESDYIQKLFQIGTHCLVAFSGDITWPTLKGKPASLVAMIDEFESMNGISNDSRVGTDSLCHLLQNYLTINSRQYPISSIGKSMKILICGYSNEDSILIFEMDVRISKQDQVSDVVAQCTYTSSVRRGQYQLRAIGQIDFVHLIINGYDQRLESPSLYYKNNDSLLPFLPSSIKAEFSYNNWGTQDAIDFLLFLERGTMQYQRFVKDMKIGVGGPIDIATIGKAGVVWVQRKLAVGEKYILKPR